jgi:hypothetical protein
VRITKEVKREWGKKRRKDIKKTPQPETASELYRSRDRRF